MIKSHSNNYGVGGVISCLRCAKYTFIFVFSNINNNMKNKNCFWKVSIIYCGPEINVSGKKMNNNNNKVKRTVFFVSIIILLI